MTTPKSRKSRGQSLVEYIALTALVAIVSIGTVKVFGGKVRSRLNQITNAFDRNVQQGLKAHINIEESGDGGVTGLPGLPKLPGGIRLPRSIQLPRLPIPESYAEIGE